MHLELSSGFVRGGQVNRNGVHDVLLSGMGVLDLRLALLLHGRDRSTLALCGGSSRKGKESEIEGTGGGLCPQQP